MKFDTKTHRQWNNYSNFVKFLGCFLLLFAFSVSLIGFGKLTAYGQAGRSVTYSDITIDHAKGEIRIIVQPGDTILYSDAKKLDWMEATTMTNGTNSVAVIDISWINRSKEFILAIKNKSETSNDAMVQINLRPREEGLKAGLSGTSTLIDKVVNKPLELTYPTTYAISSVCKEYGYVYFYTGSGSTARYYEEYDNIEWKNGSDGVWRDFKELNPAIYANKGTSLYFRVKSAGEEKLTTTVDKQGVYVTKGTPAGKEVRFSYAKLANAPRVALNGSDLTVALRAGYEYRILPDGDWVNVVDAHANSLGKIDPVSLYSLYKKYDRNDSSKNSKFTFQYQEFDMQIRIAATSKKPSSKAFNLKVVSPKATDTAGIEISYTLPYSKKDGISFTNVNPDNYQVALISGKYCGGVSTFDASKVDYKKVKWYNAKSGTKEKPSTVKIPGSVYTGKNVIEEPILIYRIAPVNESKTQKQVIASKAIAVNLPTEVVQTATDSVQSKVELVQGTAAEGKIEVTTTNVSVGATPKISAPKKPTGITITADKVKTEGKFTISVKIASTAQVVDSYKFNVTIEGITKEYTVTIKAKPATPSPTVTPTPTP
ncbi:MAG TPA: hypothetical protein DHW61_18040 [Lachnoclostridium phytofermentans]|uniref:Uncharacterized protein n=1 Tax=Lachnoclostridium phytofermentans TaxID=66219 RepID=A0A3D2XAV5_9FIRM|nr:hypothetical protein [Lachnoclostridium sp.]HCL04280.1 hypothetical protein [Lachnoclostridium phytofermentans]